MNFKVLLALLTLLQLHLFALDDISAIPESQKKVVDSIILKLDTPNTQKVRKIILEQLQPFFEKDWSAHWVTNYTAANSKIEKSDTKFVDVMIYNNERVTNINFIFFKKERQLVIHIKQYIEGQSDNILKLYNKTKKNPDYERENETDHYAYFTKKGYMDVNVYHIKSPCGMVIYESTEFKDIE
ncbi:MAG: hypothetical protein DSY46_00360 [Hydrogenimonas sp.]|nr:MAG: hypothetical protein DSY46_00360 [Hydrogenimonas sp.]